MSGASVAATRVTLRPLNDGDAESIAPWLAEAVAAVDGVRPGDNTPSTLDRFRAWMAKRWSGARCDVVCAGGAAIGFIVWRTATVLGEADLEIDALAVRRDARNLGYGVEAVMCLEEARPGAAVCAAIPRSNGLAVYFWLRAGYRPLRPDESREMATDPRQLWMVRRKG